MKSLIRRCLLIALITAPSLVFACSVTPDFVPPDCPKGQHFDLAASCACIPDNPVAHAPLPAPPAPKADINGGWISDLGFDGADACVSDADCVTTSGPCSEPIAIHRSKVEAFSKAARQRGATIGCPTVRQRSGHPSVRCLEAHCQVI